MPKTVGALRGNTNLSKKKASTDYGIFIESLHKIFSEVCGEETETPTITHEQYLSIMELLGKKDNPAILPIQIAYYTGMRLGEACGLAWQDINLEEQYLTVRRSLRYNSTRHKLELGTTKRRKIRTVDFGDTLTEILKQARRKQHRERAKALRQ